MESQFAWMPLDGLSRSFLKTIASFAPFLIPLITIFAYEAPISLRIWIAVKGAQETPIPSRTHSDANERTHRVSWFSRARASLKDAPLWMEMMKLLVFLAVITEVIMAATLVEDWKKDTTYFALMFIPATAACVEFYRMLWLPSELWVNRRGERGFIVNQTRIGNIGRLHTLGSLVFALSITTNAFLTRGAASVNMILATLVHPLLRDCATQTKSQSVKAFTIRTCALAMTGIVVATGFILVEMQIDMFTTYRAWQTWLSSILMSPLCFSYIFFFLRLDYALADHEFCDNSQSLPKSQDGSSKDENRSGIPVPPASAIPPFDKPYYTAAWLGYVVVILCLAGLSSVPAIGGLPLISADKCDAIGFFLAFLAPPLICIFVIILALWRGEFAKVWSYAGEWSIGERLGDARDSGNLSSVEVDEVKA